MPTTKTLVLTVALGLCVTSLAHAQRRAPAPGQEGQKPQKAREGYWRVVSHRAGGHKHPGPRPSPPKIEPGWWTLADFVQHLSMLFEHVYVKRGEKEPVIHCIGYQIDKEGHSFLMALAKQYHGQYRRVQRLK